MFPDFKWLDFRFPLYSGIQIPTVPGGRAGGEAWSCWMVTGSQAPTFVSKARMSFKGLPVVIENPPNSHSVP